MNISFENADKINGLLTLTIEKDDYQPEVDKILKDYRKKANIPGFRPGQAPMGLIKRQYGTAVKVDAVNKLLGDKIYEYIRENKIQMLGEPMPNTEKQPELDFEKGENFEFVFDIAVAPEFKIELSDNDSVDYYNIEVDDKLVDQQVDMFASRAGHYEKVEEYDAAQNDMLKGDMRELDAEGNTKEGGIVVESAVLMPSYIKVDEQKALFDGAKLGNIITFNPKKAYPDSDVEVSSLLKIEKGQAANMTSDFTYQITEISRFTKAELNQELFDQVYGEGAVADEKAFREKIAEGIKLQLQGDQDYKFLVDVRAYAENKVGELQFPTELLKKIMLNNNKDKGEKFVDDNFDASIKELKWHLIKEQLVAATAIKVEDADVKAVAKLAARAQFAQYGMNNIPEEYLEKYADDMLKDRKNIDSLVDRAVDMKLTAALKGVVKLNEKTVSLDEFNKLFQ
ncbi:MAG: trigger factor [Bacteroides sp.]|nr:trigger factor [Bacteroides sp.]MBO5467277.1 trigger factor [Prevotella sp.]